jgi:ring-1,2-phenylacetyl-CoA epoxidase subunit PaaD
MTVAEALEKRIWSALETVTDPEIPVISIVEMGMVHQINDNDGVITVEMLPTFVGCPALGIIEKTVKNQLVTLEGVDEVIVRFVYDPPWTSDRIAEEGREKLRSFGIAPPPRPDEIEAGWKIDCPYCGSPYTRMENLFGPAACRSILYCKACKNPFEAFKPV